MLEQLGVELFRFAAAAGALHPERAEVIACVDVANVLALLHRSLTTVKVKVKKRL